ncbi:MAG TPA: DUF4258 domain-containing protein [Polyangiaceae bacterium]
MTSVQALAEARRAGVTGRFYVVAHARDRQRQRGMQRADIQEGLRTAIRADAQENHRWRLFGGRDLGGDNLTLIVVFENGVVVITVY